MIYEKVKSIVGDDTLEIFGESGTSKTTMCIAIANDAVKQGKKVLYIDTERNLLKRPEKIDYVYHADFDDVVNVIQNLKAGYDVIILDSMGLPILGKFAWLNARDRGDILLKAQAISSCLKIYSEKNKALCVVTNQPESAFGKPIGHIFRPFGDKSIYFYKEVWTTTTRSSRPDETICLVKSFRSRSVGRGTLMFEITINKDGVKIEPKV